MRLLQYHFNMSLCLKENSSDKFKSSILKCQCLKVTLSFFYFVCIQLEYDCHTSGHTRFLLAFRDTSLFHSFYFMYTSKVLEENSQCTQRISHIVGVRSIPLCSFRQKGKLKVMSFIDLNRPVQILFLNLFFCETTRKIMRASILETNGTSTCRPNYITKINSGLYIHSICLLLLQIGEGRQWGTFTKCMA